MTPRLGLAGATAGASSDLLDLRLKQNDGRFGSQQQPRFQFRDGAILLNQIKGGIHQRKRFFLATLARPQTLNRVRVASVHHQLEAADSFEGKDLSVTDDFNGARNASSSFPSGDAFGVPELQARPAMRAGIGLGVKPAIGQDHDIRCSQAGHIVKSFHRSVRTIVWQCFDDRESWPAICAVRERIAVSSILRDQKFPGDNLRRRRCRVRSGPSFGRSVRCSGYRSGRNLRRREMKIPDSE